MKILLTTVAAVCGLVLGVDPALAQTWTQTSAPTNYWQSIASSADGSKLVAAAHNGPIYISTNSGVSWILTSAPNEYWFSVASSADGTKLVAVSGNGPIYVSTNSGSTWVLTGATNEYWCSVASSADGNKLVAVAPVGVDENGPSAICTSTDSGTTWIQQTNIDIAIPSLISVSSSADGVKLVVVGDRIYYSTNSGATWAQTRTRIGPSSIAPPQQLVASSADGNKWAVALTSIYQYPAPIYTSTNSGDSWTLTSAPSNTWLSVAMSADGNKIVAVAVGSSAGGPGPIYISTDFGTTWTSNNTPRDIWRAVASSADGGKLVAASAFFINIPLGSIYTSQSVPKPSLSITPSNENLTLSWIVPSTNFALQQSSNLTSWADVTNPPTLNLTNLQDEVVLSPTNSSSFYRLKTP